MKKLIFVCLFAFVGCQPESRDVVNAPAEKASVNLLEGIPVIDAHVHIGFSGELSDDTGFVYSEVEFRKQLQEAGIVAAVAMGSRKGITLNSPEGLNIIQCMALVANLTVAEGRKLLESGVYRCMKVYLGYEYKYAKDPYYKKFYKLAEEFGVPVVFHTGDTYDVDGNLKYAHPLTIDEVAVEFRKVTFVIAHMGNPWIEDAAEVAYKNPNVYVEGSALMIGNLSKNDPLDLETYIIKPLKWTFGYMENPTKLMFGTDWPLVNIKAYRDLFAQAIPKEHLRAVFYDNAARVYKIGAIK